MDTTVKFLRKMFKVEEDALGEKDFILSALAFMIS